ncbi:MAG: HD domain-containing protein [Bacilli bacterium]|nr:HD domain-containing protein [Bacilli bacterium]
MLLGYYLTQLGDVPQFLEKYLKCPSLVRLKKVGYFCGMDYASKDIYSFKEYISRFDHSLSVALLTYKLTKNKCATIAALFHDVATPCFSHVIDYMNGDYEKQESTEEYTEVILRNDNYLSKCLKEDQIDLNDIINFKKYTVVDNDRPKVCADRIDGVILTGIAWTKNILKKDIDNIVDNMKMFINESNEDEIGFKSLEVAKKVVEVSESIDVYCHSNEDNYMMHLLAKITQMAIDQKYISYEDLYTYDEEAILKLFKEKNNKELNNLIKEFENKKLNDIPVTNIPNVKVRDLNPIVNGKRYKDN